MWSGQYTILIVFPGRPHYLSPISCSNLKTFLPIFKHLESNSCLLGNWPALYLFDLVDERDSSVRNERILSFLIFPFFRDFRFFFRFFGFDPDFASDWEVFEADSEEELYVQLYSLFYSLSLSLLIINLSTPSYPSTSSFSNSFGSRSTSRSRERRSSASFSRIDSSRFYSSFLWSR